MAISLKDLIKSNRAKHTPRHRPRNVHVQCSHTSVAEFEVGNVSGMDPPTTDHSLLLTLTTCPALFFLPIPTTLQHCSRLVYFAHPFLKVLSGDEGTCGKGKRRLEQKKEVEKGEEREKKP